MLDAKVKNWYRDNYLVSTQTSLIQADEINAVLNSDLLWWAQGLPRDQLKKALGNSLCLGLYQLPQSSSDLAGESLHRSRLNCPCSTSDDRSTWPETNRVLASDNRRRDFRISHRRLRLAGVPRQGPGTVDVGVPERDYQGVAALETIHVALKRFHRTISEDAWCQGMERVRSEQ
jgi:hypothetical protein